MDTAKKVLIVEDEIALSSALKETLTDEGFTVVTAFDGEEGLALAKQEKPDLILIDILMPKMDGITMVREIRKVDNAVQMIFLTNADDVGHISDVTELTFSDYIIKADVSISDIVKRVKEKLHVQ